MIKFRFESAGHPDYSKIEEVEMNKEYSVSGFVKEFLDGYSDCIGTIKINNCRYDYKGGALTSKVNPILSNCIVKDVRGVKSYRFLDIELILKGEAQEKPNEGSKRLDICELLKELYSDMRPIIEKYEKIFGIPILSIGYEMDGASEFSTDIKSWGTGIRLKAGGQG